MNDAWCGVVVERGGTRWIHAGRIDDSTRSLEFLPLGQTCGAVPAGGLAESIRHVLVICDAAREGVGSAVVVICSGVQSGPRERVGAIVMRDDLRHQQACAGSAAVDQVVYERERLVVVSEGGVVVACREGAIGAQHHDAPGGTFLAVSAHAVVSIDPKRK